MMPQSSRSAFCEYHADSGRGSGNERAICILLTQPDDVLAKNDNFVLDQLSACGLGSAIGLYFYRFKNTTNPFIKIGECTRKDGISVRFQRGWHGTEKYADTYLRKKTKSGYVDSELLKQIRTISSLNPRISSSTSIRLATLIRRSTRCMRTDCISDSSAEALPALRG